MAKLIKQGAIVDDAWQVLQLAAGEEAASVALPAGDVLFPLAVWQARKAEILARGTPVGVWLGVTDEPAEVAADLPQFALVAVDFPKFTDGRGYSTARLLRERHGYTGELRAIGEVLHDQLFFMQRCGFDSYVLKEGKDIERALAAFATFPNPYQGAVDQPLPHYRRRAA